MLTIMLLQVLVVIITSHRAVGGYCGKTLFTDNNGTITSPNFYGAKPFGNMSCTYQVKVKAQWVELIFNNSFDVAGRMPYCKSNYIEVSIGCGADERKLSRFCSLNSGKPHDIYAKDGCIKIKYREFSMRRRRGRRGFQASYRSHSIIQPKSTYQCLAHGRSYFNNKQGMIVSPGWPFQYTSSYFPFHVCNWDIMVASSRKIKFNIMDIDLNNKGSPCDNPWSDILEIVGKRSITRASSSKKTYCGRKRPFSYISAYYNIGLSMKKNSHSYSGGRGFAIGYVTYTIKRAKPIKPIKLYLKPVIGGSAGGLIAICIFIYLSRRYYRYRIKFERMDSFSSDSDSDSNCSEDQPNCGTTTTTTTICDPQPPPVPGYYPPKSESGPSQHPNGAYSQYPPSYPPPQPGTQPYPQAGGYPSTQGGAYPPNYQPYPSQCQGYPGNIPTPYIHQ